MVAGEKGVEGGRNKYGRSQSRCFAMMRPTLGSRDAGAWTVAGGPLSRLTCPAIRATCNSVLPIRPLPFLSRPNEISLFAAEVIQLQSRSLDGQKRSQSIKAL